MTFRPSANGDTPPPLRHADVLNGWSPTQPTAAYQPVSLYYKQQGAALLTMYVPVWDIDRLSSVTTTKSLVQHQIQSIDEKRDSRGDVVRAGFSQRCQSRFLSSILIFMLLRDDCKMFLQFLSKQSSTCK